MLCSKGLGEPSLTVSAARGRIRTPCLQANSIRFGTTRCLAPSPAPSSAPARPSGPSADPSADPDADTDTLASHLLLVVASQDGCVYLAPLPPSAVGAKGPVLPRPWEAGRPQQAPRFSTAINCAVASPDGRCLAAVGDREEARDPPPQNLLS